MGSLLGRLVCWWRGWHRSPPGHGWDFLAGGFEVWCWTCGKPVRLGRDRVRPYRDRDK